MFLTRDFPEGSATRRLRDQLLGTILEGAAGLADLRLSQGASGARRTQLEESGQRALANVNKTIQTVGKFELALGIRGGRRIGMRKPPLELAVRATGMESQLALAVVESLADAVQWGRCPYCGAWWTADHLRRRTTCGRPDCDAKRKAEWRRANPEATEAVATRVRKHRRRIKAASRTRGARSG